MNIEEQQINKFIEIYPQFKPYKSVLRLNLYCDILDISKPENERRIALSDLPHTLSNLPLYATAKSWKLV